MFSFGSRTEAKHTELDQGPAFSWNFSAAADCDDSGTEHSEF